MDFYRLAFVEHREQIPRHLDLNDVSIGGNRWIQEPMPLTREVMSQVEHTHGRCLAVLFEVRPQMFYHSVLEGPSVLARRVLHVEDHIGDGRVVELSQRLPRIGSSKALFPACSAHRRGNRYA